MFTITIEAQMSKNQSLERQRKKVAELHSELKKLQDEIAAEQKRAAAAEQSLEKAAERTREMKANLDQAEREGNMKIEEIKQRRAEENKQLQKKIAGIADRELEVRMETIELRSQLLNAMTELTELEAEMNEDLRRLGEERDQERDRLSRARQELEGLQSDEIRFVKLIGQFGPNTPPIDQDTGKVTLGGTDDSDNLVQLDRQIATLDQLKQHLKSDVTKYTAMCACPRPMNLS